MLSGFPKISGSLKGNTRRPNIKDVVIRDWSGGLKITDNNVTLRSKYSTVLQNLEVNEDNSFSARFGYREFANVVKSDIINAYYFNNHIIAVLKNGDIVAISNTKVVTTIWDQQIANDLPFNPTGWSDNLNIVNFITFKKDLIIVNGKDKPVIIDENLKVTYLQDLINGSNVNVPIGSLIASNKQYVIIAGVEESATIYISSMNTSGTWPGDAAPNDSTTFDLSNYVGSNSRRIRAIKNFRNYVIVFFETTMVIIELGNYNDANIHVPRVVDDFSQSGILNHNCVLSTDKDLIFFNRNGVFSAEKNVLGSSLETSPISKNLDEEYYLTISKLSANAKGTFIVDDAANKRMLFFFNLDSSKKVYALKYNDNFTKRRWSEITGFDFDGAVISTLKRVFFFKGTRLYLQGNSIFENEQFYLDDIDYLGNNGQEIFIDYESPWLDANDRLTTKRLINIISDSLGDANFTLDIFVDKFYKDENGEYNPALSFNLTAGDKKGFGNVSEPTTYGSGRGTNTERFYRAAVKFKFIKFRIHGQISNPLTIQSLGLIYSKGNYLR